MVTTKIKELAALKTRAAALEQEVSVERAKALARLPADYGFESSEAFIAAFRAASSGGRGRKAATSKVTSPAKPERRRRAKITDETRAAVKKLVGEGKTGAEIAKAVKISLPSVQNIKKDLGLVQKRKK